MMTKAFGFLLAANFEAVALMLGAWLGGQWLDAHVPQSFSWMMVTFVVAGLIIIHSWYIIFRTLMKMDADQRLDKKAEH